MEMSTADPFEHPYPLALERFPTIRQSALSAFDDCALSSYFEAEYRRGWSTHPQARGRMFHSFAAECLRAMALQGEDEIPVDAALSILRDVIRQENADKVCPVCETTEIKPGIDLETGDRECARGHRFETEFVNVPLAMVKDLFWCAIKWANDNSFDHRALVDVEQRLEGEVRYPHPRGGYVARRITGKLDALLAESLNARLDHGIVLDWKDTWGMPAETEVSFGGYFQQRTYALLVFQNYPSINRVTLREQYVRFSQVREAVLTREDEPEIMSELAALVERFDRSWDEFLRMPVDTREGRKPFRPTPGKHCNWCTRPAACPVPVFAKGEGRIIDEKRAAEVARQLLAGEATVKAARAALRAYADVHGPVAIKDAKGARALGYTTSERVERPSLEQLEQAERNLGRPLTSVEVRKLYRKKVVAKFQAHTPVDVDEAAMEAELVRQLEASIEASRIAKERAGLEDVEFPFENVVPLPPPK